MKSYYLHIKILWFILFILSLFYFLVLFHWSRQCLNTTINKSMKSRHSCLAAVFRRNIYIFLLLLQCCLLVSYITPSLCWGMFLLLIITWKIYLGRMLEFCNNSFLCLLRWKYDFCSWIDLYDILWSLF